MNVGAEVRCGHIESRDVKKPLQASRRHGEGNWEQKDLIMNLTLSLVGHTDQMRPKSGQS